MVPILEACLARGFKVLVLTNGMNTLLREKARLETLHQRFTGALTLRISLITTLRIFTLWSAAPVPGNLPSSHSGGCRTPAFLRGRGADHVG